jgi:hypothetical protein
MRCSAKVAVLLASTVLLSGVNRLQKYCIVFLFCYTFSLQIDMASIHVACFHVEPC